MSVQDDSTKRVGIFLPHKRIATRATLMVQNVRRRCIFLLRYLSLP